MLLVGFLAACAPLVTQPSIGVIVAAGIDLELTFLSKACSAYLVEWASHPVAYELGVGCVRCTVCPTIDTDADALAMMDVFMKGS